MASRAKFKCEEVTLTTTGGVIKLLPVTTGNPENEKFFKWTPHGEIKIGTINPEVVKDFVPGKEYYVDFTQAE